jgi:serine O-acetyltransferase
LRLLRADVAAIFRNDPAATNLAEVLLYPGLHAIVMHRVAHALWRWKVPFVPRMISQWSRFLTGIEIHPGARIGAGFFIESVAWGLLSAKQPKSVTVSCCTSSHARWYG